MRKIFAGLMISLDGVTEAPEQWTPRWFNAESGADIGANMAESDTMLLGRRTYLFEGDVAEIPMKLVKSTAFSSGVLALVYVPER